MRRSALLLAVFVAAVALRVAVGGVGAASSPWAGLIFAGCLGVLVWRYPTKFFINRKVILTGLGGALVICLPVLIRQVLSTAGMHTPAGNFLAWALVVGVVAAAEELFLRGSLYDAVTVWRGETTAIFIAAIAFATLHIPLYGWGVVPLDLAVGVWLGLLRSSAKTAVAPAVAHITADLAGWWLR